MDPTGRRFQSLVQVHRIGESGSACILDGRGITIACTDPSDLLRECDQGVYLQGLSARRELALETCHGCHGGDGKPAHVREAMAVAPIVKMAC